MSRIFVSYTRKDAPVVQAIVEDLEALGNDVWFDLELTGGQIWWDQILNQIRVCDIFVIVIGQTALDSIACRKEYKYASAVGKPILPIRVSSKYSEKLLPPVLSQIQFVEYTSRDRATVIELVRALSKAPPATPIPHPIPIPPDAPISRIGYLTEQIQGTVNLSSNDQSSILIELQRNIRNPEMQTEAHNLLVKLRKRPDLLANIAEEIDRTIGNVNVVQPKPGLNKLNKALLLTIVTVAFLGMVFFYYYQLLESSIDLKKVVNDSFKTGEVESEEASLDGHSEVNIPIVQNRKYDFINADTNILIFNASSTDYAAFEFAKYLRRESSVNNVTVQNNWLGKWIMKHTRIYYIGSENQKVAEQISQTMPGIQFIIDYDNQRNYKENKYWPDKPRNRSGTMIGFNENRDIVIFIGEDMR